MASWADYLGFMKDRPTAFPLVRDFISADHLESANTPVILGLKAQWEKLCSQLNQDSRNTPIPGIGVLRFIIGESVSGFHELGQAKRGRQQRLMSAVWDHFEFTMRQGGGDKHRANTRRLTACSGREAAWVSAIPSRPEYCLSNKQWRTAITQRLGLPQEYLANLQDESCDCHRQFDRRTRANNDPARNMPGVRAGRQHGNNRNWTRPLPVDPDGQHDQCCSHSYTLGRHNTVQSTLEKKLRRAGFLVRLSRVEELRTPGSYESGQTKADLTVDNLRADGVRTLVDVGCTHTLLRTYLQTNTEATTTRAYAANRMRKAKLKKFTKIINEKDLGMDVEAVTLESFGAFGAGTWAVITKACDPSTHPLFSEGDFNAWSRPDPKRDFILSMAFALQRGNANMLRRSAARRSNNRRNGNNATDRASSGNSAARAH